MNQADPDPLHEELATYEAHREELLGRALGKFVLIHGSHMADVYDTKQDAIAAGYRAFGNVPFLVKQILPVEVPQNYVSNHLVI